MSVGRLVASSTSVNGILSAPWSHCYHYSCFDILHLRHHDIFLGEAIKGTRRTSSTVEIGLIHFDEGHARSGAGLRGSTLTDSKNVMTTTCIVRRCSRLLPPVWDRDVSSRMVSVTRPCSENWSQGTQLDRTKLLTNPNVRSTA